MCRRSFRRAWDDTFRLLGGWALVLALVVVAPVGFVLHWLTSDLAAVVDEVNVWLIYGLAATGLVFGGFYLANLLCAPYRIERDARRALESDNARLKAALHAAETAFPSRAERVEWLASLPPGTWRGRRYIFNPPLVIEMKVPIGAYMLVPVSKSLANRRVSMKAEEITNDNPHTMDIIPAQRFADEMPHRLSVFKERDVFSTVLDEGGAAWLLFMRMKGEVYAPDVVITILSIDAD